jgi:predicted extracellular nuclease
VRVGAAATLKQPLVLDFRNNIWKFQPTTQVTAATDDTVATFTNTRKSQPAAVGGDLKLATFNVLNYFNTTGEAYNLAHPGACTSSTTAAATPSRSTPAPDRSPRRR